MKELALIEGDLAIYGGKLSLLEKRDKLEQQMAKIILTEKGGKFFPRYGSEIGRIIGQSMDKSTSTSFIENEIREALEYYKKLQKRASFYRELDDEEYLLEIAMIDAQQIANTIWNANVAVLDRKGHTDMFTTGAQY